MTTRQNIFLLASSVCFCAMASNATFAAAKGGNVGQKEESIRLFSEATRVFRHPRCMNCHPAGDAPTQGQDMHVHMMNVQRGPDDHGAVGMKCATCHGSENNKFSEVPGAPKWGLAPRSMGWQGLNDAQLCQALKDPKKNHGMTMKKFIKHNAEDPLVAWGWNPGAGRTPVPGTQKEFGDLITRWVATGAHCPETASAALPAN